ncbi:MAG TPA: hypothetical protein VEV86_12625, partial [Vicinamibacterales bacterium]|nr:hypothetical protein [Vicinamibacterales bacterium]
IRMLDQAMTASYPTAHDRFRDFPSKNRRRIVQCPKIYVLLIVRQFSKQAVEVDTPEALNIEREIVSRLAISSRDRNAR